jgi:diguanylate cyclase (GGDEF)-like protein/PAS domain S-box-containing protein
MNAPEFDPTNYKMTTNKNIFQQSTWPVALIIIMLGLIGVFVNGLKQGYDEKLARATTDSQNMARVLEEHANSVIQKTDILLIHIAGEIVPKNGEKKHASDKTHAYLKKLQESVPEIFRLRIIQSDGYNLASSLKENDSPLYYGDRSYFTRHRDNPSLGLDISEPIIGRTHPGWQIMLSRRLNYADGSFAGIVSSGIALSYFEDFFSTLDMGENSNITLLSKDLYVITRFPISESQRLKSVRGGPISAALQENPVKGTISGKSTVDGIERIFSYRQVGNLPLIVVVGLSKQDVLAEWRRNALIEGTIMIALLAAIGLLSRSLMRHYKNEQESKNQLREITSTLGEGVYVLDKDGRVTFVNPEAERLLGWSRAELLGKNGHETFHYKRTDGTLIPTQDCPVHQAILTGKTYHALNDHLVRNDGTIIPVSIVSSPILREGEVTGSVAAFQDITLRLKAEEKIRQLAFYDTLTDLPNRRLLLDRLNQALAHAERHQRSLAVMFMDIDHFKNINDTLGHDIGDELLKVMAARLNTCVRSEDTIARQGGDEFVVVLSEIGNPQDAAIVAEKIIKTLGQPISIKGHELQITCSIGIVVYPAQGTDDAVVLMKKADIAMYAVKEAGRNGYRFFQD